MLKRYFNYVELFLPMDAIEYVEDISPTEKQKAYKYYCQLMTILHDYAIGKQLHKNKIYSWAITSHYYSLMHCGRFICMLGIDDYLESHAQSHQLLSGTRSNVKGKNSNGISREFNYEELLQSVDRYLPESEDKINALGNKLKIISEIRNNNSYEHFIIAHQCDHRILKDVFSDCYSKIATINWNYIDFCLDLLVGFINIKESPFKDFYIAFLKNQGEEYENPTQSFIFESKYVHKIDEPIIDEIKELIDTKLNELHTDSVVTLSSLVPITYGNYGTKSNKMDEFKREVDSLQID